MAFRATTRTAGSTWATALSGVFAAGSAAVTAITGAAFVPSRVQFVAAEVSVAVDIELGQGGDRVGDLHRVDDAIAVGVEGCDDRGHWASAAFMAGRVVGVGFSGGQAQGGSGGGDQEGLVDEFHGCVSVFVLICFGRWVRPCFEINKHPRC